MYDVLELTRTHLNLRLDMWRGIKDFRQLSS